MNNIIRLFLFIVLLACSANANAACSWVGNTGTAASVGRTDVSECLTDAGSKTGVVTINLPSGAATWTSSLTANMETGFTNVTSLNIIGAGTAPSVGSAESSEITLSGCIVAFYMQAPLAKKWRISNIEFIQASLSADCSNPFIQVTGKSRLSGGGGWRIDHNHFKTDAAAATGRKRRLLTQDYTYGVIDHNYAYGAGQFAAVTESLKSGLGANRSWNRALSVNTSDQVFIEDNTLMGTNTTWPNYMISDCANGGRVTVRYNDATNLYIGGHGADSTERSCLQYVSYKNILRLTGTGGGDPRINVRDGTQIHYDNTIVDPNDAMYSVPILVRNYRSMSPIPSCAAPFCNPCDNTPIKVCVGTLADCDECATDGDCGGETGACQNIDENDQPANNGYPCRDQTGFAPDGTLTGQLTKYPSLFWNNTHNGTYVGPVGTSSGTSSLHLQNNRDWCHGTTKPSSCDSVTTTYTGYTYPHPLAGEDTAAPEINDTTPSTFECDASSPVDIALTITTNENATCRYAVDPEEDWADMTEMATTGTQSHSQTLSLSCAASYSYNVRCVDSADNYSAATQIDFSILEATADVTAPTLSNPLPSGSVACGASSPVSKTISLTCTDAVGCTAVACDTESEIDIDSMDVSLSQSGTTWSATVESLACDQVHTYYCKAEDAANNESATDTTLSFSLTAASTVTEAESGALVAPVSSTVDATASGGYFVATATEFSGTATYTYNIATAGYYQLIGNFQVADSGSDSWTFAIDGGTAQTWHLGGTYGVWVEKTFGTNQLFSSTGNKSVVFTGREVGAKFDWFKFSLLACTEGQRGYCISEGDCTGVGGTWSDGVCSDPVITPSGNQLMQLGTGGQLKYRSGGLVITP